MEQTGRGAGDPDHVAESGDDRGVPPGQGDGLVDVTDRSDTDRAAGARDQADLSGEKAADSMLMNGHGVGAADLHQGYATIETGDGCADCP